MNLGKYLEMFYNGKDKKGLINMIKGNDIKPKSLKQFSDVKSFPECPFHYCDSNPVCKEECRYS